MNKFNEGVSDLVAVASLARGITADLNAGTIQAALEELNTFAEHYRDADIDDALELIATARKLVAERLVKAKRGQMRVMR